MENESRVGELEIRVAKLEALLDAALKLAAANPLARKYVKRLCELRQ